MSRILPSLLILPIVSVVSAAPTSVKTSRNQLDIPIDAAATQFVEKQNRRAIALLSQTAALKADLESRAAELMPKNTAIRTDFLGQEFAVQDGSLIQFQTGSKSRTVVDAATLPKGASVTDFRMSPDGKQMAYGFCVYGTDWTTWHIIRLKDLKPTDGPFYIKSAGGEEVVTWDPSGDAIYYEHWLSADEDQHGLREPQIWRHTLKHDGLMHNNLKIPTHQPNELDKIVFEDPERPHTVRYGIATIDRDRILVYRVQGQAEVPQTAYLVSRLRSKRPLQTKLLQPQQGFGRFLGLRRMSAVSRLSPSAKVEAFFRTSSLGSNYGVIAVDLETRRIRTVLPAHRHEVLTQAQQIGNVFVLQYFNSRAENLIRVMDTEGRLLTEMHPSDFGLPNEGTLSLMSGGPLSRRAYFTYSSVTLPTQTLQFDVATLSFKKLPSSQVDFDGSKVRREWVQYPSDDGTMIPMDLYFRSNEPVDSAFSSQPQIIPKFAYLYSYGSIGIANTPSFNRKFQLMLELGGMIAIPHTRGGGEFGLAWQLSGSVNKWKMFEDVRSASRFLQAHYPSVSGRVALTGRSYGGMMTLTEYTHFQDDFSIFTPVVSVSDPIAFLFAEQGWWAIDDFHFKRDQAGQIIYDQKRIAEIDSWSPLRAVEKLATLKPLMAFSEQYDTRAGAQQTTRFVRAVQNKFGKHSPVYMIELANGGHSARAEVALEATFIAQHFSVPQLSPMRKSDP